MEKAPSQKKEACGKVVDRPPRPSRWVPRWHDGAFGRAWASPSAANPSKRWRYAQRALSQYRPLAPLLVRSVSTTLASTCSLTRMVEGGRARREESLEARGRRGTGWPKPTWHHSIERLVVSEGSRSLDRSPPAALTELGGCDGTHVTVCGRLRRRHRGGRRRRV
eukprot:scaffold113257_cov26-Tisochrysis_lutea.AAC.2